MQRALSTADIQKNSRMFWLLFFWTRNVLVSALGDSVLLEVRRTWSIKNAAIESGRQ
jgi:hypothetical protein